MKKTRAWWTGLLAFACAGAMVAACGGGTPSPEAPTPTAGEPNEAAESPAAEEKEDVAEGPTAIPHPIEGREKCTSCHTEAGGGGEAEALPADHAGRDDTTCQGCHKSAS